MAKPRVFISHSAKDDPEALGVLDALSAALSEDFAVRVDKDDLKPGDNWRNILNTWIGGCHAAIVLLSDKALKSKFVAYEVSILTFRTLSKNVKVIPIFLSGVDDATVKASGLEPSQIQEKQAIKYQYAEQLIADIKEELRKVKKELVGFTPFDRQAAHLEKLLRSLSDTSVKIFLSDLDPELNTWEHEDNPHLSLAIKMMSMGITESTKKAMRQMRDDLAPVALQKVFELIATSWVDVRAAGYIEKVAKDKQSPRVLATNGKAQLIAQIYVRRASGLPAEDSWNVVASEGFLGEHALDELKEKVREVLSTSRNLGPEDSLEEELEFLDGEGEPVFIALPAAGVDGGVLKGLRRAFPTIRFFFLAGSDPSNRVVLSSANVEFIIPPLEEGFEDAFCTLYARKRRLLFGEKT